MSDRDITLYVVDVFIAIDKVHRYTSTFHSANELLHSEINWDATIRELEIIGEATKYLLEYGIVEPQYRRIVDFRNQISHGYFGIDEEIVWDVVQNKLDRYKSDLNEIVRVDNIDLLEAITKAKMENGNNEYIIALLDKIENELC